MKKILLQLSALAIIFIQSCNTPLVENKLENYDVTFTSPELSNTPEFVDLKVDDADTEFSSYDFNIGGHARIDFKEVAGSVYPSSLDMLKTAITQSEDFVELIDTKQLSNGAFGIIFKMKGSSGAVIKNYIFYYKKGNRYFKITPVFYTDLDKYFQLNIKTKK